MKFTVPNMTCGGCARGVTATIKALDADAVVEINVETKLVEVQSTQSFEAISLALAEDGFPPQAA
ncbi:copper chaperone [Acinetobacter calcoaceticus]|uniref:Copper chaperone n=1 Tax=Acinetobacter calcoaceticus TaxID=471 RepID=A0A4R1XQJ8_ACICA|nr:copper chaperone [Acinetobacter calcoaceticus]